MQAGDFTQLPRFRERSDFCAKGRRARYMTSTDRPDERRAGPCLHAHADLAAAAGREPFEQAFENLGAGRMIVGHIGHQLPALLPDFETTRGLCNLDTVILCIEECIEERRELLRAAAARGERCCDLIEI